MKVQQFLVSLHGEAKEPTNGIIFISSDAISVREVEIPFSQVRDIYMGLQMFPDADLNLPLDDPRYVSVASQQHKFYLQFHSEVYAEEFVKTLATELESYGKTFKLEGGGKMDEKTSSSADILARIKFKQQQVEQTDARTPHTHPPCITRDGCCLRCVG